MALKFDLGEALSQAAHAAGEMAKGASATVESAAKGVANAAENAGNAIVDTAASASEAVGSAMCSAAEGVSSAGEQIASSDAGKAIAGAANAVGGIAVGAAMGLAQGASSLASGAASTVEGGINAIKENSFSARLRKARIKGFRDGIKQGAYLAGEKRHNFIYAYVATLCFLMRCDGDFSQEEREWLEDGLDYLKLDGGLPDDVKARVQAIADDEDLSFDRVKDCLDNVSIVSLGSIAEQLQVAAASDGQVTEEEEHACRLFADYMAARAACVAVDEGWAEQAVEKSVREYGENLERIDREFKERTRLQDADAAFVVAATMLQVARVLVINSLTEVERAGAGNAKEDALHSFQDRVFSGFGDGGPAESGRLFASKSHILSSRGVPYDATRYEAENFKVFKGANHRFATLGHDPVLGLVFGTSNIMTNSITCVKDANVFGIGARIPATYSVSYDAFGKNPLIGAPAGTVEMLVAAGCRRSGPGQAADPHRHGPLHAVRDTGPVRQPRSRQGTHRGPHQIRQHWRRIESRHAGGHDGAHQLADSGAPRLLADIQGRRVGLLHRDVPGAHQEDHPHLRHHRDLEQRRAGIDHEEPQVPRPRRRGGARLPTVLGCSFRREAQRGVRAIGARQDLR